MLSGPNWTRPPNIKIKKIVQASVSKSEGTKSLREKGWEGMSGGGEIRKERTRKGEKRW
jgi:hypothetical protein